MIQGDISIVQLRCDTPVTISPFVLMVDRCKFFFGRFIFIYLIHLFQMIEESRTSQLSD